MEHPLGLAQEETLALGLARWLALALALALEREREREHYQWLFEDHGNKGPLHFAQPHTLPVTQS
jgi:hypothetical protein